MFDLRAFAVLLATALIPTAAAATSFTDNWNWYVVYQDAAMAKIGSAGLLFMHYRDSPAYVDACKADAANLNGRRDAKLMREGKFRCEHIDDFKGYQDSEAARKELWSHLSVRPG